MDNLSENEKTKGVCIIAKKVEQFHLRNPITLLVVNIVCTLFLIEELIDATPPNFGYLSSLTAGFGLISFMYIRKHKKGNYTPFLWILQILNWIFIAIPFAVIIFLASFFL